MTSASRKTLLGERSDKVNLNNVGTGAEIFQSNTNNNYFLRSINGNGNVSVTQTDSHINIDVDLSAFMQKASNLADVSDVSTARDNLQLGTASLEDSTAFLQTSNNLSDLTDTAAARTSLVLGSAAQSDTSDFLASDISSLNLTDLDVSASLYPPRLTTVAREALSPSEGAVVYDTDLDGLYVYDGTAWKQVTPDPTTPFDPNSLLIKLTTLTNFTTSSTDFSTGWTVISNTADISFSGGVITPNTAGTYRIYLSALVSNGIATTQNCSLYLLHTSDLDRCRTTEISLLAHTQGQITMDLTCYLDGTEDDEIVIGKRGTNTSLCIVNSTALNPDMPCTWLSVTRLS